MNAVIEADRLKNRLAVAHRMNRVLQARSSRTVKAALAFGVVAFVTGAFFGLGFR